ncbi:MAG TPA: transposase [Candidatus Paceibacterota bacterium]
MDFYHVLNRGVEGRALFLDSSDYVRFVHNLYQFNDTAPAAASERRHFSNVGFTKPYIRERIVDIHGWCLMKNHYHLLLSERVEGGLSLFLRKLNVGYANYFNERYERSGTLFQGRTKKILIEKDAQFNYILHYIHLNPLDYLKGAEGWRIRSKGKGIKSAKAALDYLEHYRWSSYLDYCGKENFPSVVTTEFFGDAFGKYETAIREYLKNIETAGEANGNEYRDLCLE